MKKLRSSLAAKLIASLLLVAMAVLMLYSVFGIGIMYERGAYSGADLEEVQEDYLYPWCVSNMYNLMESYRYGELLENLDNISGMGFAIYDEKDQLVYASQGIDDYILKTSPYGFNYPAESVIINRIRGNINSAVITDGSDGDDHYFAEEPFAEEKLKEGELLTEAGTAGAAALPDETAAPAESAVPAETAQPAEATAGTETPAPTTSPTPTETLAPMPEPTAAPDEDSVPDIGTFVKRYKMVGYVLDGVEGNGQVSSMMRMLSFGYVHKEDFIVSLCASVVIALLCFVFLMAAAGHKKGREGIQAGFTERVPFDLFTALLVIPVVICVGMGVEVSYANSVLLQMVGYGLAIAVGASLCLWWCMSFAVRLKMHTVLKSCLCFRVLAWCWRLIKRLWAFVGEVLRGMRLLPKAALVIGGILLVEFFWLCAFQYDLGVTLFGWVVERLVLVALTLYVLLCMKRLLQAGKEISEGNLDYHVDTARMRGPLKEHGEQLNRITDGMTKAVDERMKSERFRTELITNVSHDIKTPLTSIINYVDLLEKEEIDNDRAREYLEVLSRQSARLKKLIDDLMEASKASTGNVAVNWERCQLNVLLDQCAGEYAEKLKSANLELVLTKPEEPVTIQADGRHMWRVFDNLLSNICKYAMAGTRVYLNMEQVRGMAVVTFRNISDSQLNISGDELMERFVRGDRSRNTEGSGLGLSIARSLVQLQKGQMNLTVDGDLFKVVLKFDVVE